MLWVHFHQRVAIFRARLDAFLPMFHAANGGHAAAFGSSDELAIVLFG
jgi:hypothetical protein